MSRKETSLNVLTIVIILAATIVTLTEFGNFRIAQGQGNLTIGNLTLTPEQKDAICNPNNPLSKLNPVNTTESHICGLPVTVKPSNTTTANTTTANTTTANTTTANTTTANTTTANTTTGAEAPPTDLAPSAAPPSE
jgi:cell division protein FtsN